MTHRREQIRKKCYRKHQTAYRPTSIVVKTFSGEPDNRWIPAIRTSEGKEESGEGEERCEETGSKLFNVRLKSNES